MRVYYVFFSEINVTFMHWKCHLQKQKRVDQLGVSLSSINESLRAPIKCLSYFYHKMAASLWVHFLDFLIVACIIHFIDKKFIINYESLIICLF